MDGFLTIREASEYLRVKGSTLYAWAERGVIPCYKFGRLVRFKKAEIEAWADSQKTDRVPAPCEYPTDVADIGDIIEFAKSSVLSSSSGKARPASRNGGG